VEESPLFYSIKDVSKQLGLPSHVLRFWETKFSELKPVHRSGSCRYYRKEDVDLLIKIRDLLHNQGYTIKGAKSVLEKGVAPAAKAEAKVDSLPVVSETIKSDGSKLEIREKLCTLRGFVQNILDKEENK
jgi:DNA-binding transcriptional MerR regulator